MFPHPRPLPASRARRLCAAAAALALVGTAYSLSTPLPAQADPADAATYTVTVGSVGEWTHPDDTPASMVIDEKGDFHLQGAHALYGKNDERRWTFWKGTTIDDITWDQEASSADDNWDTTTRCNEGPTGRESTRAPGATSHSEANYCDLTNMWVDPDTGDWYGLVHNEFTPRPFDDGLHYDSIDYAVSHDKGVTWTIVDHAITSPYSTRRGDTDAFPEKTYYYGDGDPRLYVDYASGYFYAFYGSRVVDKGYSWVAFYQHVARAPISGKMAAGTWQKWYNGTWTEAGIGGRESNMTPVTADSPTGYTAPENEYKPTTPGWAGQQVADGTAPATSPLFVMDVTYNAHLGLYIAEPQNPDQSGNAPQEIYATRDLSTQKWFKLGDTGTYTNASWYRWFLDSANGTSSAIVGRSFRAYCSYGCSTELMSFQYVNLTIDTDSPAQAVDTSKRYTITNADGLLLSAAPDGTLSGATTVTEDTGAWTFHATGDGSYTITGADGRALGVDSSSTAGRAWDAPLTLAAADSTDVGQQWFVVPATGDAGSVRLVNRYSGLALGMNGTAALTTPQRTWDRGSDAGGVSSVLTTVAAQTLTLAEFRPSPATPTAAPTQAPTTEPTQAAPTQAAPTQAADPTAAPRASQGPLASTGTNVLVPVLVAVVLTGVGALALRRRARRG